MASNSVPGQPVLGVGAATVEKVIANATNARYTTIANTS